MAKVDIVTDAAQMVSALPSKTEVVQTYVMHESCGLARLARFPRPRSCRCRLR